MNASGVDVDDRVLGPPKLQGRPWLSELPDELIVHILSRMPTLDAVKTVLLRRFGNLWRWVHNLQFIDSAFLNQTFPDGLWRNDPIKCGRFPIFVFNVLILHKRPSIDTFGLSIQFNNHKDNMNLVDQVKTWLRFAFDRQATEIIFRTKSDPQFMEDHSILPNMTSQSLEALGLSGCRIDSQLHVNLTSLNSLLLNQISMSDEAFQHFVSGCPSLRKLCVLRPRVIKKLSFRAAKIDTFCLLLANPDNPCLLDCPSLKNLELEIFSCLPQVVNLSSIRYVNLKEFLYATNTDEEVSALKMFLDKLKTAEVFQLSFNASMEFLLAITNMQLLETRWKCIILEFGMFSEGCLVGMYQLIRSSGDLKELIIRTTTTRGNDTAECVLQLPPCVLPRLTTITLRGMKPCSCELKLLEYLLRSAPVLDKLVIINEMNDEDKLEFAERVSSFAMASTNATIIFK